MAELAGKPDVDRERVAGQVAAAVEWARKGGHVVLWLRGHGEPPRSGRDARSGEYRLFGPAGDVQCSACDLKSALKGQQIDVVILEACYSASLEVVVDLLGACRVLIGVPGEAQGEGFPWRAVASGISGLERRRESCAEAVGERLRAAICGPRTRAGLPWSVSVIDMAGVGEIRRLANLVGEEAGCEVAEAVRGVQWARERSAQSETLGASCDLLDLSVGLEGSCGSLSAQRACGQLRVAVERCVRGNISMVTGPDAARCERGGLTVFLPSIATETVGGYAAGAGARIGAGWVSFVERYLRYGRELVPLRVP